MLIWHPLSTNDLTTDASVEDAADDGTDFFLSENWVFNSLASFSCLICLTVVLTLPEFVSLSESLFGDLQFCWNLGCCCFEKEGPSGSKLVSLNEKSTLGSGNVNWN